MRTEKCTSSSKAMTKGLGFFEGNVAGFQMLFPTPRQEVLAWNALGHLACSLARTDHLGIIAYVHSH